MDFGNMKLGTNTLPEQTLVYRVIVNDLNVPLVDENGNFIVWFEEEV
jgi:hypothetical protein